MQSVCRHFSSEACMILCLEQDGENAASSVTLGLFGGFYLSLTFPTFCKVFIVEKRGAIGSFQAMLAVSSRNRRNFGRFKVHLRFLQSGQSGAVRENVLYIAWDLEFWYISFTSWSKYLFKQLTGCNILLQSSIILKNVQPYLWGAIDFL